MCHGDLKTLSLAGICSATKLLLGFLRLKPPTLRICAAWFARTNTTSFKAWCGFVPGDNSTWFLWSCWSVSGMFQGKREAMGWSLVPLMNDDWWLPFGAEHSLIKQCKILLGRFCWYGLAHVEALQTPQWASGGKQIRGQFVGSN